MEMGGLTLAHVMLPYKGVGQSMIGWILGSCDTFIWFVFTL
jgi:hypothetical protein